MSRHTSTTPGEAFEALNLNGRHFTKQWIRDNFENLSPTGFDEWEKKTLNFCGQWLAGAREFKVQTSGSTGKPRPILLNRAQISLSARLTGEALSLKAADRAFVCLSPDRVGGLMMLVRGLVLNLAMTVVNPASSPFERLDSLRTTEAPFDFASFVPSQFEKTLSSPDYVSIVNKMKAILLGGAPVSAALLDRIQRLEAPVYHTFGMTETASHFALRRLNGPYASETYEAFPGVELGSDSRGCLTVKSRLTGDRRIVTNDLVALKSDRQFHWRGRIDNVINSGGVKIQAEKVERAIAEVLLEENGVSSNNGVAFFVGPLRDETYGQLVAAVFEGERFSADCEKRLVQALSERLGGYEIPRKFVFVESLARVGNGKIDRRANLARLER